MGLCNTLIEKLLFIIFLMCCLLLGWTAFPGKNWPVDPREIKSSLDTICVRYQDGREHCEGPGD